MKIRLKGKDIQKDYSIELLKDRGIEERDIEEFLAPSPENVGSFNDLVNIDKGVEFIQELITSGEKALLLIDSDCDGYMSAGLLYKYLMDSQKSIQLDYITHEEKGHGLRDVVKRRDVSIDEYKYMIIIDAGSNDIEHFAEYPNTKFLVIDHHDIEHDQLVGDNYIIINNQSSPNYENKALCGAGMGWQFIRALKANGIGETNPDLHLDMVAVATIADLMDSTQLENRYIIDVGLSRINNPFLNELVAARQDAFQGDVIQDKIAWYTTPIINGMCRSGSMEEKIRMFEAIVDGDGMIQDLKRGAKPGDLVTRASNSRREATNAKGRQDTKKKKLSALAKMKIENEELDNNKIITLILDEDFGDLPSTLNGVVANSLAQEYSRPVLLGRVNRDGVFSGSARGVDTFDIGVGCKEFLSDSNQFEYASGHSNAFGFAITEKKLDSFIKWSNEELKDISIDNGVYYVDFIRNNTSEDIPDIVADIYNHRHIWGVANKPPLIGVMDIVVSRSDIQVLGSKRDTIKINKNGVSYMFFRQSPETVEKFLQWDSIQLDIAGTMNMNIWAGTATPQIIVQGYNLRNGKFAF